MNAETPIQHLTVYKKSTELLFDFLKYLKG